MFSAPSIHTGFAVRNKVNLLVAGYSDIDIWYGGTGIYNIVNGKLIGNVTFGPNVLYREVTKSTEQNIVVSIVGILRLNCVKSQK